VEVSLPYAGEDLNSVTPIFESDRCAAAARFQTAARRFENRRDVSVEARGKALDFSKRKSLRRTAG